MIYINPTGGLGNALFQIAGTYTIALDNNDTLYAVIANSSFSWWVHGWEIWIK